MRCGERGGPHSRAERDPVVDEHHSRLSVVRPALPLLLLDVAVPAVSELLRPLRVERVVRRAADLTPKHEFASPGLIGRSGKPSSLQEAVFLLGTPHKSRGIGI